jgi:hypothetical protein
MSTPNAVDEWPYTPNVEYDQAIHGPFEAGLDPELDALAMKAGYLRCRACGVLPVTHGRLRYHSNRLEHEYDNALFLRFTGGYGQFIDPSENRGRIDTVLCHDCAHALCESQPWLTVLLDPANSHSHTETYTLSHPDHYGWDYDRRKAQESSS